jgi:hypothetical protein
MKDRIRSRYILHQFFLLVCLTPFLLSTSGAKEFSFGHPPLRWHAKHSNRPKAPGPNFWSHRSRNVFLDSRKFLHLKTTRSGERWDSAEVFTDSRFGYGEYTFFLIGNMTHFHRRLVLGLFLYQNDHSEIDIEFSRWGQAENDSLGLFTVHWRDSLGNDRRVSQKFSFHLSGNNPYTTFKIRWYPDSVQFLGYRGHYPELPSTRALIGRATLYPEGLAAQEGKKKIVMNLYWYQGKPPRTASPREYEIIIRDVWYRPFQNKP